MGSAIDRFLQNADGRPAARPAPQPTPDPAAGLIQPPTQEAADPTPPSRLDAWLAAEPVSPDPALATSLHYSTDMPPEQAAEVLGFRRQTGLPADVIARNLPRMKADAARAALDPVVLRQNAPTLAEWMAQSPHHASVARDDVETLGYLERQFRHIRDQFQRGRSTVELADIGTAAILGRATPEQRRRQAELERNVGAESPYGITGFLEGVPGAIANQLPILGRSLLGKVKGAAVGGAGGAAAGAGAALVGGQLGPQVAAPEEIATVPAAALAVGGRGALVGWRYGAAVEAGKMEASLAYLDYEKLRDEDGRPLGRDAALGAAVVVGVVNGLLEGLTGVEALRSVPGLRTLGRGGLKRALASRTARQAITGYLVEIGRTAAEEGVTEFLQSLVTSGAGGLASMLQDGSGEHLSTARILEALSAAAQEGRAGAQGGGGIVAATGVATVTVDVRRARQAQRNAEAFKSISEGVQSSKLRERMPEAMQDVMERLTKDGPAEFVYTPVGAWTEYFQSVGLDPADVAEEVLGSREPWEEAQRTGADLAIPTARYAVTIAPTEHNAFFLDVLRASPTDMNAREAKAFLEQLDAQDAETQASAADQAPAETAAAGVAGTVTEQLVAAGIDERTAQTYASVYESAFRTLGERAGVDPLELFNRYGLEIQRAEEKPAPIDRRKVPLDALATLARTVRDTRAAQVEVDAERAAIEGETAAGPYEVNVTERDAAAKATDGRYVYARDKGGNLRGNLANVATDGVVDEIARLLDANIEDGGKAHVTVAPDENFHTFADGRAWVGMKGGAVYAVGRIKAREKAIARLEAELASRGIEDVNELVWRRMTGTSLDDPTAFEFGQPAVPRAILEGSTRGDGNAYQQDLFGIPAAPGGPEQARAAQPGVPGDVLTGAPLSRDEVAGDFATRTKLVKEAQREIGATVVNAPEDAARALALKGRSAAERFDALVTDVAGKPLAIVGSFKGTVAEASVYTETVAAEAFRIPGAANIWFAHNHPSGAHEFSNADRQMHAALIEVFRGSEIAPRGHLVIAAGTTARRYSFESPERQITSGTVDAPDAPQATMTVPVLEREIAEVGQLGGSISSASEAQAELTRIAAGRAGIVLVNRQHAPVAFVPVDPREAGHLRHGGRMDRVHRAISLANAAAAFIVDNGSFTDAQITNLAGLLNSNKTQVLDVAQVKDGTTVLWTSIGRDFRRQTFHQDARRGRIRFGADRQFSIDLFKTADLSTFLHETGHFYLEVLADLATAEGAPPTVQADFEALLDWLGVTTREELGEKQHEQFARGFEAYLMEGKAPTSALRTAFARFRVWLISVYRQIRNLDVQLTPEVVAVFDRMLATDEEIRAAEHEQGMTPLFADPAAVGMTEAEAARYTAAVEDARRAAEEALSAKLMAELQREQQKQWKDARALVEAEVAEEVSQEPVYVALAALQKGVLPNGARLPDFGGPFKLSKDALVEQFGPEILKRLPRPYVYTRDGGLHPDVIAEAFGFASGRELVDALVGADRKADRIQRLTDERMRERFGDMLTDGTLPVAAMQAVHTDQRAQLLRAELQHLASTNLPALKGMVRKVARRVPPLASVREQAESIVEAKKVREIRPIVYQRAEARAATEAVDALLRGDIDAAFDAKQRQWLNHELYRAATSARETVEVVQDEARRLFKADDVLAKSRDMDFVNAARAIAASYGLGRTDQSPAEYLDAIRRYDPATYETVQGLVEDATAGAVDHRDATYGQIVTMRDAIAAIWALSRRSRQMQIDGKLVDRELVHIELESRLMMMTPFKARAGYTQAVSSWERAKLGLVGMRAALRRMESWVDAMDGGDPNGVFRRYVWTPISEATSRYRVEKTAVIERYLAIVKAVESSLATGEIDAREIGYRFSGKAELLGAILHTGNESNLDKLLRGRGWDGGQWDAFLRRMWQEGTLTKADYDYAQAVWDLFEELKAGAQKAHKEMYGHYFAELTAREVVTPVGTYRGGYVPAKVDPFAASDATIRQERDALLGDNNSFMFPTAGRGFTKRRTQRYAAPLMLDLRFVPMHIDAVLRFTHIEPRVKDVGRIFIDRDFRRALDAFDPAVGGDLITPWLQRAARQTVATASQGWGGRAADTFFRELRTRTGLQVMTANVVNTLQQFTGLSIAAVKVRPRYLRNALWSYVRHPKQLAADVVDRSPFMATRVTAKVMEVQSAIDDLLLNPSTYEQARAFARKHGYFLQAGTQGVVDLVVWAGAYDEATAAGVTDPEAVRRADAAVRLTQGSFAPEDVSRFETGTPFVRAFTMFYSYFNMQANLLGSEFATTIRELGLRKGAGRLLYVYALGFMVPAVLSEMIVQAMSGEPWDDDDDGYLDDVLVTFFGAQGRTATAFFPFLGPAAMAGINAFNDKWYDDRISTSPAVSAIESTVRAPHSVYKAVAEDGDRKRAARDFLTAVGLLSGLPVAALARPAGYLLDQSAEASGPLDLVRGLMTGRSGTQ